VKEVDPESAQQLGCPTGKEFTKLFGSCTSLFAIHFEQVQPHEVPVNQGHLKKSAEALKKIKEQSKKANVVGKEHILAGSDIDTLFKPASDRPVRDKKVEKEQKLRAVQFPNQLIKRFTQHAWPYAPKEFMGWITGSIETDKKHKTEISFASGLFMPRQDATTTCVFEIDGGSATAMLKHCEECNTHVVGWIHSHPTFEAFFSSIDQHMMYKIQKDLPSAYGIVLDKNQEFRCLRLSEAGMKAVEACTCADDVSGPNHASTCSVLLSF